MSESRTRSPAVSIVSNIFYPDELGGAALMTDLALFLQDSGCRVNVVTTFAYYPRWKVAPEDRGVWRRTDDLNGIPVRRVRIYVPSQPSTGRRLLSDVSYFLSLSLLGRGAWRSSEVILTTCPMFSQILATGIGNPFGRRIPKIAIVQDFVVDAAIELKMIRNPLLGRVLRVLERRGFRMFDVLTTISGEMLAKLDRIAGPGKRTLFIPNWIHRSLVESIEERKRLAPARQQNLLFYSGNVGRKQGLPNFLDCFKGTDGGWQLHINGDGADFDKLKEVAGDRPDVVLRPLQGEASYIDALLTCSACLVTQMPGVGANFLPSKILPALASGTPILAICEQGSPLAREVNEAGCGEIVEWSNVGALKTILEKWGRDPGLLRDYGRNSLRRSERYERKLVLDRLLEEIRRLAGAGAP